MLFAITAQAVPSILITALFVAVALPLRGVPSKAPHARRFFGGIALGFTRAVVAVLVAVGLHLACALAGSVPEASLRPQPQAIEAPANPERPA
jgi:hypothetical protein